MRLYTYFRSSAAFRVRIALNLKRLDYEPRFVHLRKGQHRQADYRTVNPQALLPALELDDGHRLAQSLAIMEYLDETHPRPPLLPPNALERARVRSIAQLVACEIHPLNNLRTLEHLRKLGHTEDQVVAWYGHWIVEGLAKLEADLAGSPQTGRFCHGDAPTLADCCLVPQIFNARRYEFDPQPYPTVMRVFDECMKLDAFDRAQPSRQPDAE
ncbi:MAG TPA: maleylacetoacetate isomerase [Burkholderiales bacterium]|nr:maleylacetoacetate isomerase [Burkholderiales bacterium]